MFIKKAVAISPQETFNNNFFEKGAQKKEGTKFSAIEPHYEDFIPAKQLRRMGKALKMSVSSFTQLKNNATNFDAIIIGTAFGGMEGSINFIDQIINYDEGLLTPAGFINSTPNAIAGYLAQKTKSTGYNNTHTNEGLSFEGAITDLKLLFLNKEIKTALLGAIEEISSYNFNLEYAEGLIKKDNEVNSDNLLKSNSPGSVSGEGATMFLVEDSPENAIAEIAEHYTISYPNENELVATLDILLKKLQLSISDIDTLISGRSGDVRHDHWCKLVEEKLPDANIYTFKNLVGDYPTATAFATWLSCQILQEKNIPKEAIYKKTSRKSQNILIYNQYKGRQHSFILMRK